jgi:hypothetical protein
MLMKTNSKIDSNQTFDSERDALVAILAAWDSLAGGTNYTPREIQLWLIGPMHEAIKKARLALKT